MAARRRQGRHASLVASGLLGVLATWGFVTALATETNYVYFRPATPVESLTHDLRQAYELDQFAADKTSARGLVNLPRTALSPLAPAGG